MSHGTGAGPIVVDPLVPMTRVIHEDIQKGCQLKSSHAPAPAIMRSTTSTTLAPTVKHAPVRPANFVLEHNSSSGLCAAFMIAYNNHLPLRLSPDVVWVSITQSVARWVHSNAEKYRHVFVSHEGQRELKVFVPPEWEHDFTKIAWESVLCQLQLTAASQTHVHVAAAFAPEFSTTCAASTTACAVVTLAATKAYFTYGMETLCGLGEVYLDGTPADWTLLRTKTQQLRHVLGADVGSVLAPWLLRLDGTLHQLETTASTRCGDPVFWQHAFSKTERRGSGGGTYLSGWFLHFFLADEILQDSVRLESLPCGFITVPFFWQKLDGSREEFTLCAGTWHAFVDTSGAVVATPEWVVLERDAGFLDELLLRPKDVDVLCWSAFAGVHDSKAAGDTCFDDHASSRVASSIDDWW